MAAYVDFNFYSGVYLGTAIAQADFPRLALRASEIVDELTFSQVAAIVTAGTDTALIAKIKMATCAVADEIFSAEASGGSIASERVGGLSVTYHNPRTAEKRYQLAVKRYLWDDELMYGGPEVVSSED